MAPVGQDHFINGDLGAARDRITSLSTIGVNELALLARIDYLEGRYSAAIDGFTGVIAASLLHPVRRYRALRQLSMAYFVTNRFDEAGQLPLRDSLSRLMRAFSEEPYRLAWNGATQSELPFLQEEPWELPRVEVRIDGEPITAMIDTGGDHFSVPWSVATRLGIQPVTSSTGMFAGGHRARTGQGILRQLDMGDVTVMNAPVSINSLQRPVIGTGLLRQFAPTLDYPGRKLVLRPRQHRNERSGFPILLAGTHLLIAAGALNGTPMRFLVDSGLEVTNGGCFLAPPATLQRTGIPQPDRQQVEGVSGAGPTKLAIGEFPVGKLTLGSTSQEHLLGLTGIFPEQLSKPGAFGFPLDGLVSHGFLRHYRWTIDFDGMGMTLAAP